MDVEAEVLNSLLEIAMTIKLDRLFESIYDKYEVLMGYFIPSTEEMKSTINSTDHPIPFHILEDSNQPVTELKVNEGELDTKGTSNQTVSVINCNDETWQFQRLQRELAATITDEEANTSASAAEDMNESTIASVVSVVQDDTCRLILSSTYVWYASSCNWLINCFPGPIRI